MSYNGKTDWKLDEMVYPEDMNRIEGQIEKNTSEIGGVSGKIGNPSDGEKQLTLFGKIAAVLKRVIGVDDKVGTSDDAKTKPTLFGKIAGIGDTLSENLTPVTEEITGVLNKVTGIDTKIGTSGDTAGTATLFGQVKDISEKMPTGAVKSVQRGVLSFNGQKVIEISEVVPEKCVVILNTLELKDYTSNVLDSFGDGVYLVDITSTSITLKTPYNTGVSWQVVEYF